MAEFLIHLGRGDPLDPLDYQPGDVVEVQADGEPWSPGVLAGNWCVILRIPGLPLKQARRVVRAHTELFINADGEEDERVLKKRIWRLHLDEIPLQTKRTALRDGSVTVSLAGVKAFLRHKVDGRTVDQA